MKEIEVKNAKDVKISDIPQLHIAWSRHMGNKTYVKEICAFDIETTTIPDIKQAVMYIWQFAIENTVFYGRTWEEFKRFISLLKAVSGGKTIVVFVHNLSYEIQFLSGIFHFDNKDIFPTEPRHVLRANIDNIEFRCSYRLTNLDLKSLTKRYNVDHQKLDDFAYTEQRFSWTPLSDRELQYCFNDVIGLVECIHAIMDLNNDDLYTLPLTSTGFVRRECKKAMRPQHQKIMECFPDYEVFQLLRAEFRGGNTHANRYYADEILQGPITSMDISSSYPSQQCNRLFPCSPFQAIVNPSAALIDRLIERGRAVLFTVTFYNISLRDQFTAIPYIPIAKCSMWRDVRNDNGRVLSAGEITITLNEIDWQIIVQQYTFDCVVERGYKANKGPLPQGLIYCNVKFFKSKTELKNVEGQELFLLKSKELLNGIYGMSVQNPAKGSILFNDCLYEEDTTLTEEQLLQAARKRAFTLYQYGCWTTAHARAALQAGIDLCGERLVYVDTDSCKYLGSDVDFSAYNEEQRAASIRSGLYATDKHGVTHYGGVYEHDGVYDSFITQGAKKYAYTDNKGIHVTVSGVGKQRGKEALYEAGGLDAFREGFVFHNCGKTRSIYNDGHYGEYTIDGHVIDITRNVVIEEQDYTLSRTDVYTDVIQQAKVILLKAMKNFENLQ